jgi:hypothetical protein
MTHGLHGRWLESALLALVPAALAVAVSLAVASWSPAIALAGLGGAAVVAYLAASRHLGRNLAIFGLYLGLVDGWLRLRTGNEDLTLARDALLYSIVAGGLLRLAIEKRPVRFPPLSGWVVAFVLVVLAQLANPNNGSLLHSLASLRQHLEFVPLFFLGYAVVRTTKALAWLLALLVVAGAANGLVSLIQFNMTPDELGAWGPGYVERINGTGDVSGRVFRGEDGVVRTRPFGLGADSGAGGSFGLIALCAIPALLVMLRRLSVALLALPLSAGVFLAIVTSQSRTVMIGSVLCLVGFGLMAAVGRRALAVVAGLLVVGSVLFLVAGALVGQAGTSAFRYESIAPDSAVQTAIDYRTDDLSYVDDYVREYPFGAGLGSVGPAASFPGGPPDRQLNAESQFNFMAIEVGVLGLLILLGLHLRLLVLALARIRHQPDPAVRIALAALAGPTLGGLATWFVGVTSTASPGAPYLWLSAGVLAYWLGRPRQQQA